MIYIRLKFIGLLEQSIQLIIIIIAAPSIQLLVCEWVKKYINPKEKTKKKIVACVLGMRKWRTTDRAHRPPNLPSKVINQSRWFTVKSSMIFFFFIKSHEWILYMYSQYKILNLMFSNHMSLLQNSETCRLYWIFLKTVEL